MIAIELAQVLRGMGRTVIDPLIITDAPNLNASTHRAICRAKRMQPR